jgi:uncharacterized membrane protein YkvA (DUF1232 family)
VGREGLGSEVPKHHGPGIVVGGKLSGKPVRTSFITGWKDRARQLRRETYALYLACRHPRTAWYARLLGACIVAYALSPIDLIPDFVPVLGYVDDLVLIPISIAFLIKMIPADVMRECREEAALNVNEGRKNWWAAGVIVVIWLAASILVVKLALTLLKASG